MQHITRALRNKPLDGAFDMQAIVPDFRKRRARHQAAHIARRARTDGVVVGIKQIPELRMEHTIAARVRRKNKRLEEPGGVAKLPFDGRALGGGLHHAILDGKRFADAIGGFEHAEVAAQKFLALDLQRIERGARLSPVGEGFGFHSIVRQMD